MYLIVLNWLNNYQFNVNKTNFTAIFNFKSSYMDSFLVANSQFRNYTTEHYLSVALFLAIGILFIYIGQNYLKKDQKYRFIFGLMLFIFFFQVIKVPLYMYTGVFNYRVDLPLHLCNISPIFMFFAYFFRSRIAWSIFFLWIMAGTFQSLLTPTLTESFPHYEWWRYWIIHVWLVTGAFYGIFVLGYRIKFKDMFYSLFWLNVLAFAVYFINVQIGANYMYMSGKPDGKTMYDLLGDWPLYILQLEFVALLLFSIIYLPFYLTRNSTKEVVQTKNYRYRT